MGFSLHNHAVVMAAINGALPFCLRKIDDGPHDCFDKVLIGYDPIGYANCIPEGARRWRAPRLPVSPRGRYSSCV